MSYDWTPERYRTRQPTCWDPPWTRQRKPTCWDPPWTRRTTVYQHSSSYELDMYSPSPPRRRPTCWDPPVYRETPRQRPFNEVSVYDQPLAPDPNSRWNQSYTAHQDTAAPLHTFPRRYSVRGPASQQPRSTILAEDPINAKLDHLLEVWDRKETLVDATNRRFSKFRSLPQAESDLDQPNVSAPIRNRAYPPSRNNEAQRTESDQTPAHQPPCWEPPLMAPPVAAPPPLLHVDQQLSPSCCHPTTHLSQAGACLELPTTLQQPLLQRSPPLPLPRSDHPPQPKPAPPLEPLPYSAPRPSPPLHPLSVTVPLLVSNGHSQAVPSSRKKEWQTNLHNANECGLLKVVPCLLDVVEEEGIVEEKLKEIGIGSKGLIGSKDDEDSDIFKMIKMITVLAFDPGICVSFTNQKSEFIAMQMAKLDPRDSKKELPHGEVIKSLFVAWTFRIELHMPANHVVFNTAPKFNRDDEGKCSAARCVFDPGGDNSPKLLLSILRCSVVSTLRTRWISTVGELIRSLVYILLFSYIF